MKTSCRTTAFCKIPASVCVFGRVSCAVRCPCHMLVVRLGSARKLCCKQKKDLKKEQANRTSKRIRELLDYRDSDSESDSEGQQSSSIDGSSDTLSLLRRDLSLGLLCLLLLIVLQNYWISSTCLRK